MSTPNPVASAASSTVSSWEPRSRSHPFRICSKGPSIMGYLSRKPTSNEPDDIADDPILRKLSAPDPTTSRVRREAPPMVDYLRRAARQQHEHIYLTRGEYLRLLDEIDAFYERRPASRGQQE